MAVSYKTKFATKVVQTELDLVLCDESGNEAYGKGSFDPTEMENMHILRTKQNKNILRLFFSERKIFGEGIVCLKISQCFELEWLHQMATTTVRGCLWGCTCPVRKGWRIGACSVRGKRQLCGVDEGPGGPPVRVRRSPRRWTQTLHSGEWPEDMRQQAKIEKGDIQTGCEGKHFHHCPERLWCLSHCTFSRFDWATWSDPIADLLQAGRWTRDLLSSLPTWIVLWSYEKYNPILK